MVASGAAKTNTQHMFKAFQSINSNYSPLANLHSNDLKCAQCTQIQILWFSQCSNMQMRPCLSSTDRRRLKEYRSPSEDRPNGSQKPKGAYRES